MRYVHYSDYKPSPFAWLDRMPEHWDVAALRWMSRRYAGGTPDKGNEAYWEDGDIPWINSGAVNDSYITEPSALITREGFANSSAKWIPKDALVMALAGQGKTKGMVAQLGIETTCNQSMAAIIPDHRLVPRYLFWWLSANYQNIRNLAGGEARDGLNLDMLGSIQCPLPLQAEQEAIARFLDAKTAQINTLVAKKRQLIAKLKEKRSALIARTVTRGRFRMRPTRFYGRFTLYAMIADYFQSHVPSRSMGRSEGALGMPGQTTERAFEFHVEDLLLRQGGWQSGTNAEWDQARALFPARMFAFIEATQPKLWAEMAGLHGDNLRSMLLNALVKELDLKGSLHVLRHGFKFYGKLFRLAYFKPAHGLSPDVQALYAQNQLTLSRQVSCHPGDHSTVDMVLAVNGLPVATFELKNPGTGQSWRHAVRQYLADRDPRAPLFDFKKRALVHFAADPDEIHMTTRLAKNKTFFLPFNRGSHPGETQCGAGNPQHASGYRTGYFWEETLQRDSFLDILGHFLFIETDEQKVDDGRGGKKLVTTEKMIFPRYHQLDAVRGLIAQACTEGAGHNYLIQHSAGSGKTNSISWLSHRLASLHNGQDQKVFDCVVVITDRKVLDKQLQDAIFQIEHA